MNIRVLVVAAIVLAFPLFQTAHAQGVLSRGLWNGGRELLIDGIHRLSGSPAHAPPSASTSVTGSHVRVHASRRYYQDASGKPVFLLGYYDWASIDPNTTIHVDNFFVAEPSYFADMINRGSSYGLNYIRVSLGLNRMHSSMRPNPIPFMSVGTRADLRYWDEVFWNGLRYHANLARSNGMLFHVALFDGVYLRGQATSGYSTEYRWPNSFWNQANQVSSFFGDIDMNRNGSTDYSGDFYRVAEFNANSGVGYYQRQIIDRAIAELRDEPHVFFELGNELMGSPAIWNQTVYDYIKAQTPQVVTQNGGGLASRIDGSADHFGDTPRQVKSRVAARVGRGHPLLSDPDGSSLVDGTPDDLRRAAWYAFAGGAAGWGGFTMDFWNATFNTETVTYYQRLMNFISSSEVRFWEMTPRHSLVSGGRTENSVLAKTGSEYVVYVLNDPSVRLNLRATTRTMSYRIYDPRSGTWIGSGTVSGGAARTLTRPSRSGVKDWVIHIR